MHRRPLTTQRAMLQKVFFSNECWHVAQHKGRSAERNQVTRLWLLFPRVHSFNDRERAQCRVGGAIAPTRFPRYLPLICSFLQSCTQAPHGNGKKGYRRGSHKRGRVCIHVFNRPDIAPCFWYWLAGKDYHAIFPIRVFEHLVLGGKERNGRMQLLSLFDGEGSYLRSKDWVFYSLIKARYYLPEIRSLAEPGYRDLRRTQRECLHIRAKVGPGRKQ